MCIRGFAVCHKQIFLLLFSEIFLLFTYYLCRGSKQHMSKALSCVRRKAHGKFGFAGWYLRVLHMTKPLPCVTWYPVVLAARLDQFFHVLHQGTTFQHSSLIMSCVQLPWKVEKVIVGLNLLINSIGWWNSQSCRCQLQRIAWNSNYSIGCRELLLAQYLISLEQWAV